MILENLGDRLILLIFKKHLENRIATNVLL